MPILLWLSRLVSSTITFAVHLVVSGGLFIVSALLLTLPDPDASVVGSVVRGIAAIWMWAATWHYLLRGVLQRPAAPRDAQRSKPTGAQAAIGTLGCLASLGAVVVVYLAVGPWADWVVAGFAGEDPTHPARVLFDRGLVELEAAAQQPERFVGYFVAAVFALVALQLVAAWGNRQRRPAGRETARPRRSAGRAPAASPPAASGEPASSTMDDPFLGRLDWATGERRWQVREPGGGIGRLVIETGGAVPSDAQLAAARGLVQRSFEVLLRASEPARVAAQAAGVALPRFVIAEATVHAAGQSPPAITVGLQVEGDTTRTYPVRSTDGGLTFTLR